METYSCVCHIPSIARRRCRIVHSRVSPFPDRLQWLTQHPNWLFHISIARPGNHSPLLTISGHLFAVNIQIESCLYRCRELVGKKRSQTSEPNLPTLPLRRGQFLRRRCTNLSGRQYSHNKVSV